MRAKTMKLFNVRWVKVPNEHPNPPLYAAYVVGEATAERVVAPDFLSVVQYYTDNDKSLVHISEQGAVQVLS